VARLRQRIADLGSPTFATREAASKELAGVGEDAEEELTRARAATPSPEVRHRLGDVLTRLESLSTPDRRREVRAVWALDLIRTPAARAVLTDLAAGASAARLTREAKAALERR
jgi:hypothetical protein